MNIEINQDLLCIVLLYSLPGSYENFRCAIESTDELPSPDSLKVKIIEGCDARRQMHKPETQGAMAANRVKWKPKTGKPAKVEAESNKQGKIALKCFRCLKTGHKAADCYVKLDKNKNEVNKLDDTFVSYHVAEAMSLPQDNVDGTKDLGPEWILDSGCTSHLCGERDRFSKMSESDYMKVNLANSASTKVEGKGIVKILAENQHTHRFVEFQNTLFVPDLRANLVSVAKIMDRDHEVIFKKPLLPS